MAKEVGATFGSSPTDRVVKAWLERKGIDPNEVGGYTIERNGRDSKIALEFWFDDIEPAESGEGGQ